MNPNTAAIAVAAVGLAIVAVAAAAILLSGSNDRSPESPVEEPAWDPMEHDISELPIGSEMRYDVSGTYSNRYGPYTLDGYETYTVVSKTPTSITFEVHGTTHATRNGQSMVFSQSNGELKTWDLSDDHSPYTAGTMDTAFGTMDVKVVDWELPDTVAGYRITDLGSKQYWAMNGYGIGQTMAYSIDSTSEFFNVTKRLVSVEPAD